ncbi:MAG: type II toxin-antitoxin system Phd/YefM family antitoxin [Parachlamydiaceae bacterium]|nr:type II toxin-antitoxin system Phd/YefM family antitoxin [Parachlamydiaceae bacterium]
MEASILDLRYHMKKILQALARNEEVKIFYHGKLKGILSPVKSTSEINVNDHPFFGMHKDDQEDVEEIMTQLRGDRYYVV